MECFALPKYCSCAVSLLGVTVWTMRRDERLPSQHLHRVETSLLFGQEAEGIAWKIWKYTMSVIVIVYFFAHFRSTVFRCKYCKDSHLYKKITFG